MRDHPNHQEEDALFSSGYRRIAGLDEAGRGALAGPVVAAAVILRENACYDWLELVRDSKLLAFQERENIFEFMNQAGIEIGIGVVSPQIIDEINILNATKKAMKLALAQLANPPDYILTDYVKLPRLKIPQKNITRGDRICLTISCASIAAKVTRDHIMQELDAKYPKYGFANHKGYGTDRHIGSLERYGACKEHRFTFGPVRDLTRLI
ncbi:MAG: ribonuclease HII [Dehalococcoidia bacterium]|nr:ribonuclease HII [Dehalococcoidia bacterium]